MNDITKIIQALENSNILIKGVTKTKNETKEQKGGFLSMLLGTLRASLLGNLLTGNGILRAGSGCPLSSTSKNKKGKKNLELVQVVLCPLLRKKNGILNAASSFNKFRNPEI